MAEAQGPNSGPKSGPKLGLRPRIALFFAALALGGMAALTLGLWLAQARYGGPLEGYVLAGLVGGFALAGLAAWIGLLFDQNLARPILGLASELATRAQTEVEGRIDATPARHLGTLAPAASAIDAALAEARAAQQRAVAEETRKINQDKAVFAALLRDLGEAAVVLTPDLRIMLYNRVASDLLGPLGLDRPFGAFLRSEPLQHALCRLAAKRDRGEAEAERFLAATADGGRFVLGRVSPVDGSGFVVIFHDATDDLLAHAERDHLFNTLLEDARRPAAGLSALLTALEDDAALPPEMRATFKASMQDELDRLFTILRSSGAAFSAATARHWPMSEVAAEDIFDALKARGFADLVVEGGRQFLQCDGFAIIGLLALVLEGLTEGGTRHDLRLRAEPRDGEVWLTLGWTGAEAPDGLIDGWVQATISQAYGPYSGRDVLDGHRTEIWSETLGHGHRIVLPLAAAGAPVLAPQEARPEFYDFNLRRDEVSGPLLDRPLADLTYVVFDTETTGLAPRGGDEIVQIAGLRLVNGRILTGESFDSLVNPGRTIPPASTRVHGIDDAMVQDAPDIIAAGRRFHAYCADSVLVAHNAAFDMTFLGLKEPAIGLEFRHPVLCTVLLSAALFEHTGAHTLDALADRLGVTIPAHLRHTAMGDATATAEVFVKMLELLRAAGIVTLGDALDASRKMRRIRRAQTY